MLSINELSADSNAQENDSEQDVKKDNNKAQEEKFYCTACGEKSTGWYQTCPHCGAVGKMEKVSTAQAQVSKSTPNKQLPISATVEAPVLFCRKCGTRLKPDALFCSECGTPVSVVNTQSAELPLHDEQKRQAPPPAPTIQEKPINIDLHDRKLSPTLRRAFLFVEDGEWNRAEEYLEKVLDEEPEDAYAYLGKLLVELKADSLDLLKEHVDEIKTSKNYSRALQYAEGDLKKFLKGLEKTPTT